MSRTHLLVTIAVLTACGGSTTVRARLPPPPVVVRIHVAVPETYKGFPLTVTSEPLPVPVESTALGNLPNQYEIDLSPEEFEAGSFQVLQYDPSKHQGMIVGNVDLHSELTRFDLPNHGVPAVVAFLMVTSDAATPPKVIPPRVDTILVEWTDGSQSSFAY